MSQMKSLLKNLLKPSNYLNVLKGYYRKFVIDQYNKITGEGQIRKALLMAASCPECAKAGHCLECYCNFEEMALSDKKCPKHEEG